MVKYVGLSDTGEFVTITIDTVGKGGEGVVTAPPPTPAPKPRKHTLRVDDTKKPPVVACSCGAEGYICTSCKKVLCPNVNGLPIADVCPKCSSQAGV